MTFYNCYLYDDSEKGIHKAISKLSGHFTKYGLGFTGAAEFEKIIDSKGFKEHIAGKGFDKKPDWEYRTEEWDEGEGYSSDEVDEFIKKAAEFTALMDEFITEKAEAEK